MNWKLIAFILEELSKIEKPEFADKAEKFCWILEETWKLAKQNGEVK
jgi:hypothetical protein